MIWNVKIYYRYQAVYVAHVLCSVLAAMPKSNRPEVKIADQIAIRSFVLGHKLPRIGNTSLHFRN